jgi:hypothetical protein
MLIPSGWQILVIQSSIIVMSKQIRNPRKKRLRSRERRRKERKRMEWKKMDEGGGRRKETRRRKTRREWRRRKQITHKKYFVHECVPSQYSIYAYSTACHNGATSIHRASVRFLQFNRASHKWSSPRYCVSWLKAVSFD